MKKILSFIMALAITATAMGSLFVMEASAGKYTEISTIFEEDYEGETVTVQNSGTGEVLTDSVTGNKYIKMNLGWSADQFAYALPSITEGKVAISFDYMKDAETLDKQSYIALADNNKYSQKEYLRLLSTNNYGSTQNKMTAFVAQMIGTKSITEAGKWYTFSYIIDMDTHDVSVKLYAKDTMTLIGELSYTDLARTADPCSGWPETKNEFLRLVHYGDANAYMDNISVKYVYEDPNLIFGEDYEGVEIATPSQGTGTVMTESNGNKYMKMNMIIDGVNDWGKNMFAYDFPRVTSGVIDISFDYMKEEKAPQEYMVLSGTNTWTTKEMLRLMGTFQNSAVFTGFDGTAMLNNAGKSAVLEAGKWYTQKVTLNLDTKEATATLYERGKTEVIGYMHRTKLADSTGYNGWPATSEGFVRIAHFGNGDACIDNIKITKAEETKDYAYSMAVVGDIQTLTSKYPDTLAGLYDWIASNAEAKNMKWVFGLGDITDNDTDEEWEIAKAQFDKLDGVVPYSVVRGNHDSAEKFNLAFPYAEYSESINGSMEENMLNTYQKFTVGDTKYMVVNLDWGTTDEEIAWADKIIAKNPAYNVIVVTHGYLNSDGTTLDSGDEAAPTDYSSLHNNGDELWNELIKKHKNITLVLSGHISTENIVVAKTEGDNGNIVTQMLIDPQTTDQNNVGTGLGLVTMLYFSEDGKNVDVEYYSTLKGGKYLSANQFSMELETVVYEEPEMTDVIFSEDYDGETITAQKTGTGEVITDTQTGNKYIKMNKGWSAEQFAYALPSITSGKVMVQFDYMKDEETLNKQSYIALADGNMYKTTEYLRLLSTNNFGTAQNKMTAFVAQMIGTKSITEAGKWYTFRYFVDMDTHNVSVTLYEKGNTTPIGTLSYENLERTADGCSGWPETKNEFVRLIHYGDADAYMDNILVKYVYDDPTLIFGEDYEDSLGIAATDSGKGTLLTDANGNHYMKMEKGWDVNQFAYKLPSITSGKITVSYDYMKDAETLNKQSYIVLADANKYATKEYLRLLSTNNYGSQQNKMTAYIAELIGKNSITEAGQWYTFKHEIDMDTHDVSVALYKKGEATPMGEVSYTNLARTADSCSGWPETKNEFVRFMHYGDADGYIDNIKINYVYDDPTLDSESIAIKNDNGEEDLVWTKVRPSSKTIDINFNTKMAESLMNSEYIYVKDNATNEKVEATVSYNNGVATFKAANNWTAGTYTLYVSGEVKNVAGVSLGDDFTVDFTVEKAKLSASIDGVYAGETKIASFADLTEGTEITVKAIVENTFGEAKTAKVVVGYYNASDAFVGIGDADMEISGAVNSEAEATYVFESFAGAAKVKFFVLDGYSNLLPISESYFLN